MKRIAGCFLWMFFGCVSAAQAQQQLDPTNLPKVIPPSPELSSLSKMGTTTTGLFTGSANVNIPLYEITAGSLKVPVALTYGTNGVRVNDIASRVGMGWNLQAGGVITCTIHDEPDEDSHTTRMLPVLSGDSTAMLTYLQNSLNGGKDTENDEYSFSVNGISGKFFCDLSGVPTLVEKSDIKIVKSAGNFTLITGDGTKYLFFNIYEKTRTAKVNSHNGTSNNNRTGWFLSAIYSPAGDHIDFFYNTINTKAYLGPQESTILRQILSGYNSNAQNCGACEVDHDVSSPGFNQVEYTTQYLTDIVSSDGIKVHFNYEARPQPEQSGDNRLKSMNVLYSNATPISKAIRKFRFEYDDYNVSGDVNQRFFLKKIYSESVDQPQSESLVHQFTYNSPGSLPSQKTLAQDYFGYANTASNNAHFWPVPETNPGENWQLAYQGGDRSSNQTTTALGVLNRVDYPTGGYEAFTYEPHVLTTLDPSSGPAINDYQGIYVTHTTERYSYTGTSRTFTLSGINATCTFKLITDPGFAGHDDPAGLDYETGNGNHPLAVYQVWDITSGPASSANRMFYNSHLENQTELVTLGLVTGHTYQVQYTSRSWSHSANVFVYHYPGPAYANHLVGLRVKQISSYDPVTTKTNNRYFTYATLPDLAAYAGIQINGQSQPASSLLMSSGVGSFKPHHETGYPTGKNCVVQGQSFTEICSNYMQVSSSNVGMPLPFSNGSPVGYAAVIESDDANFLNGGTVHKFYTEYNPDIFNMDVKADLNGVENETIIFKKVSNNFVILKDEQNVYGMFGAGNSYMNVRTRKKYNVDDGIATIRDRLLAYEAAPYYLSARYKRLLSTTTTSYDQDGLNPMVNVNTYTYANTVTTQPTKVITTDSKQQDIVHDFKYPNDYNYAPYTQMVTANVISPVVEDKTGRGPTGSTALTNTLFNDYAAFTNASAGSFYKANKISLAKAANPTEVRLRFYDFYAFGAPKELAKTNGARMSYIYGYKNAFPIAEVKNSLWSEIAYTSFEADDAAANTGWTFSTSARVNAGITGSSSYTGQLTRTVSSSSVYTVSLWCKLPITAIPTVNSNSAPSVVTRNGWNLYKWTVSSASTITVNGTNIDEVRLYPAAAQMTTMTYSPFVGVSSTCDVNDKVTYYEYDGSNRLAYVRDADLNIIKKICYNYVGQPEYCIASTPPNWVLTGLTRCQPCPENPAYNTTVVQQQYQDNSLLPAVVYKWEDKPEGTYTPCTVAEDWQNNGTTRCAVGGKAGTYTGYIDQQQMNMNPCSSTYGNTRWVSTLITSEACPAGTVPEGTNTCTNCSGDDKKCVNGVCCTGTKYYRSYTFLHGVYTCTYYYYFPCDCSVSSDFSETRSTGPTLTPNTPLCPDQQ